MQKLSDADWSNQLKEVFLTFDLSIHFKTGVERFSKALYSSGD